jgi:pimeloyl-ACP methyl ester carboxylesterase
VIILNTKHRTNHQINHQASNENRARLLADLPVSEHRLTIAGVTTPVLMDGEGSAIVLLHGPGETSVWCIRIIPKLVKTQRIVVPDLPGHGASKINDSTLDTHMVIPWLSELVTKTCPSPKKRINITDGRCILLMRPVTIPNWNVQKLL